MIALPRAATVINMLVSQVETSDTYITVTTGHHTTHYDQLCGIAAILLTLEDLARQSTFTSMSTYGDLCFVIHMLQHT